MRHENGFSLPELLATMALLAILAAIAAAQFGSVLEKSRTAACLSNLRQWGVAFALYTSEHNGLLPRRGQGVQQVWRVDRPEDWFNALPPYLGMKPYSELASAGLAPRARDRSIFVCPSAKENPTARHFLCYGMNMYLSRWDKSQPTPVHSLPDPATLALMADSPGGYASTVPSSAPFSVEPRHRGKANVLFLDGRVQSFQGEHLGCGRGDITQPDVRWKTLEPGDNWSPGR